MKNLIGTPGKKSMEDYRLSSKLIELLEPVSVEITQAKSANSLLSYIAIEDYDAIWIKWSMIKDYYIRFHDRYKKLNKFIPIIIIIDSDTIDGALCQKNDYIFSIIIESELDSVFPDVLDRLVKFERFRNSLALGVSRNIRPNGFSDFIGNSRAMTKLYSQIVKVASTDFTALILGESGSGKEIVANSIHEFSQRKNFPFISLNCAAIPENLLESELFGYEKGAFTGANKTKAGKFELANNGTIFLDEIGDMAPDLQAKLLRVLEDHTIERLGGTESHKVNIRLLAATNKDLLQLTTTGEFRLDLYHRLNVIPLTLLPINKREDDIILLTLHIIQKLTKNSTLKIDGLSMALINHLRLLPMHGNVRELENILTRLIFYSDSTILKLKSLLETTAENSAIEHDHATESEPEEILPLKIVEMKAIDAALKKLNGHITNVANTLQISRGALYKKIKEYKLK